jgi:hypothetical protein
MKPGFVRIAGRVSTATHYRDIMLSIPIISAAMRYGTESAIAIAQAAVSASPQEP